MQHFIRSVLFGAGLAMGLLAGKVHAASPDAEAQELADQAIFTDYLQLDFKTAESKLKKAISLCEKERCSPTVHAQVYRDLAVIYITGMKRPDDGRALLVKALKLDRNLALDADLTTPDLIKIFGEAKDEVSKTPEEPEAAAKPPQRGASEAVAEDEQDEETPEEAPVGSMDEDPSADCPPDFPGCEDVAAREEQEREEAEAAEEEARFGLRNWLSAALQQDFLMFSGETGVCGTNRPAELSCFRAGDVFRDPNAPGAPLIEGDEGEVSGGLTFATTRLMIGYDRMLLPNVSAGARIGYAIGGGPAEPNGPGFVPIHAEVRGSYWFMPLEVGKLRPYASVSGGIAQVDSSVTTQIVESENVGNQVPPTSERRIDRSRVTVWKKTGTVFASVGGGALYPINEKGGVIGELRGVILFPSSGMSVSLQAGYTYGF